MPRRQPRQLQCQGCAAVFAARIVMSGITRDLYDRRLCTDCVPLVPYAPRRQQKPRPPRPVSLRDCEACGAAFALRFVIDGKLRYLYRRRFCLKCSPFGSHNTSKSPPGIGMPEELREHRRLRRNQKTYRYQKKRRKAIKAELVRARGGSCEDCGYSRCTQALEFHHRDPATKEFGIGNFGGSRARLLSEVAKCDLLCANCHRIRHAALDVAVEVASPPDPVVVHRRRRKMRAVAYMGGSCSGCERNGPPSIFEFHHWNAAEKDFGLSESGIPYPWKKVVAELAKCVMLCANCHREAHAGLRELDEGLLGLAEGSGRYGTPAA